MMTDPLLHAPDTTLATDDPGDDTARRYRYQWTYAAIVCCILLDETWDVAEVYCEQHEDILIKYTDGTFAGLQVKTRAADQGPWKTADDAVKHSCTRFAKLEADFPGMFREFRFLTNHNLHTAGNGQDLRYVLQMFRNSAAASNLPKNVENFLTEICKKAHCAPEIAYTALCKTTADDSLPKLDDVEVRLVDALTRVWVHASDCTYESMMRAANNLAWQCFRASSLAHHDDLPAYLTATAALEDMERTKRIEAKRMNRSRVLEILKDGLNRTAILAGDPKTHVKPGSGSQQLLLKKIDAGGFSIVTRNSASDLRHKAEYLGITWLKKYGNESGLKRYNHILSLVLQDAADAFETTKMEEQPFGLAMREKLRSLFQQRWLDGSQLYDCSEAHLEGFAYELTALCQVQWSLDRTWEVE